MYLSGIYFDHSDLLRDEYGNFLLAHQGELFTRGIHSWAWIDLYNCVLVRPNQLQAVCDILGYESKPADYELRTEPGYHAHWFIRDIKEFETLYSNYLNNTYASCVFAEPYEFFIHAKNVSCFKNIPEPRYAKSLFSDLWGPIDISEYYKDENGRYLLLTEYSDTAFNKSLCINFICPEDLLRVLGDIEKEGEFSNNENEIFTKDTWQVYRLRFIRSQKELDKINRLKSNHYFAYNNLGRLDWANYISVSLFGPKLRVSYPMWKKLTRLY